MKESKPYAELVTKAETAVNAIKDPELRRVAFERVLDDLLSAASTTKVKATASPASPLATSLDKGISVGEFIRRLGLKKHTDRVVAFGFYLEKYSGATEFSPADINRCYYDAKMETSNTSQMIIQNIKRGYVMLARSARSKGKGKKSYTLTNTGEQFIGALLDDKS